MYPMRVIRAPVFEDNYAWILCPDDGGPSAIVDPGDAAPIEAILSDEGLSPAWVLATHHHHDHVGGIDGLIDELGPMDVIASEVDGRRIERATRFVSDGERLDVAGMEAVALLVPGHTRGSVAWCFPEEKLLFTGDTLFGAGCGRLFEGSAEEMLDSLVRLRRLPDDLRVYAGHEYTIKNLRFALELEPRNASVEKRLEIEMNRRARNEATMPSTIAIEKLTNPFLRADEPEMIAAIGERDPLSAFREMRRRRDSF